MKSTPKNNYYEINVQVENKYSQISCLKALS